MLERDVIKKTLAWCKKRHVKHIRLSMLTGTAAGWPDYLFLMPQACAVFIEFKATGKKPTKLQQHRLNALRKLGFAAIVCDDPDEAISWLNGYLI